MHAIERAAASSATLVGRARERERLERLLGDATRGRGGSCIVSGPPGIGKSALLTWTIGHAGGFRVVHATCAEHDAERAYCTVRSLIEPLDTDVERVVEHHRRTLQGVLGRGPAAAVDGLAVGGALVGLLALVAETAPLLVVVDDVHWIDASSGETFAFAAPRLCDEPVVMLFATRDAEPDPFRGRLPAMQLAGLSGVDAAELLGPGVRTRVAERLARATNGNPLAMLETAQQLSDEQRRGDVPLPDTLTLGDVLLRGFLHRTEGASDAERRILLLSAADPHLTLSQLREAASAAGSPPSALADVLQRDVLTVDRRRLVRFAHPLLAHAVYQHASDGERRAAHGALASVFTDSDVDRRAWHLARSVDGPDASAAAALVAAASTARSRSDHLAAGEALARAAYLSTGDARVRRLREAGVAFADGGAADRALACFQAAFALVDDLPTRADIALERARPLVFDVGPAAFRDDMTKLARDLEGVDRGRAALVTVLAAFPAFMDADVPGARELCERAIALDPRGHGIAAGFASIGLGIARVAGGDVEDQAASLVERATALAATPLGPATVGLADLLAGALVWIEEFSAASHLLSAMVDSARRLSALSMLAFALVVRADLYHRTGHWQAALADAVEANELSREVRIAPVAYSLVQRARVEVSVGDLVDAREHAEAGMRLALEGGLGAARYSAHATLGSLELTAGRLHAAVTQLEACRAFAREHGVRLVTAVPWAPDLVEAAVRSDRADVAHAVVDQLDRDEAVAQSPLARAFVHRCRGLVAERGYAEEFAAALDAHAGGRVPFEQARTELCFGERLRRDRRSRDARVHLERAAETFGALGARPWSERARRELGLRGSTGGTRRVGERLTPQQFRVAVAVGNGATNREAAAALFLSPRTVEQHLLRVYQALGIRSRAELVRLVATDPEFAHEPDA